MAYLVRIEVRTDREAPPLGREIVCVGSVEKCRRAWKREPERRDAGGIGAIYLLKSGGQTLPLDPDDPTTEDH